MSDRPRLRGDLVVVEQVYRGEQSFIVKDPATHKYFRFRPLEVVVMQEFDGERTAGEIAAALAAEGLPTPAPLVESFAGQLARLGLLERSVQERSVLQLERLRAERHRRVRLKSVRGSLLRVRWSMSDPDRFFDRWLPRVRFVFTPAFLVVSLALFAVYAVVFTNNFPAILSAVASFYRPASYTVEMFVVFWLTAMVIVGIHELGHGFTCKYFGGHVHEMGVMLIYFEPAFYCNVNDAWTFPRLRDRLWVTAAGSWIQLVLASIGAIVWWVSERGTLVNQVAMDAILVGGVTAVFANVNPLIPLDGYYALSDWLEVPNLRNRASAYVGWLVKRHLLRLEVPEPRGDEREKRVLLTYGVISAVYIAFLLILTGVLVLGWSTKVFGIAGALGFAVALWFSTRRALREWTRAVVTAVREHRSSWHLPRGARRAGLVAVLLIVAAAVLPWPLVVTGRFVADPALQVWLVAASGGTVEQVYASEGDHLRVGAPVVRLRDLRLEREAADLERLADSLEARAAAARAAGSAPASESYEAERTEYSSRLTGVRARLGTRLVRTPAAGRLATPRLEETVGKWYEPGAVLARVVHDDSLDVRVRLDRAGSARVRPGQAARLLTYADASEQLSAVVTSVAAAAAGPEHAGAIEARVRIGAGGAWRPGATGEARITVARGTMLRALWWAIRKRLRSDLLL